MLAGGAALGLVGALLAIPIAATIQAIIVEFLEERSMRIGELPGGDALTFTRPRQNPGALR